MKRPDSILGWIAFSILRGAEACASFRDWLDWCAYGRGLDERVVRKFETLDESGMCYFIVSVELRKGSRRHGLDVVRTKYGLRVRNDSLDPLRWRDVVNIESDGYQGRCPAREFRPLPD